MGQPLLTREQLREIPIPERPDAGPKWKGVQHGELADTIINYITKPLGFKIADEKWYCNDSGSALYGAVDIDTSNTQFELKIGQPAMFSLGVRHDNMGRFGVSFAVGARVEVCQNGVLSGDFVLKNRHYDSLDLEEAVANGMEQYLQELDDVQLFIEGMQCIKMNDQTASYLIMKAAERIQGNTHGCINWAHLRTVYELWKKPDHFEFMPRTQWSLYNCFTQAIQPLSPPRQLKVLKGLRPLMNEFATEFSISKN